MKKCSKRSFAVVAVGLLFLVAGIMKLFVMGPSGFAAGLQTMLGLGSGLALVAAWVVTLVELIGGAAILLGCKFPCAKTYKVFVSLLIAVMVVVIVGVDLLGEFNPMDALKHLVILGVLVDICSRMKKCGANTCKTEKESCDACTAGTCTPETHTK